MSRKTKIYTGIVGLVLIFASLITLSGCIHQDVITEYKPSGNVLYVNISNTTMSIDSYQGDNLTLLISGMHNIIRVNSSVPLTVIRFMCEGGNMVWLSHQHHPQVFNITGNSYTYYDRFVWG